MLNTLLIRFIIIIFFVNLSHSLNDTEDFFNGDQFIKSKSKHYLVEWKAWQILSCIGIFGTFSNAFLLQTFYLERKVLASSVNAMVCMDTIYRLLYSTLSIHWRTYNMVFDETLFHGLIGKEMVI